MHKNPPYQQWKDRQDKSDIGRKAFQTLSPALQATLQAGLLDGPEKSQTRFDDALNALKLDIPTRDALLRDLKKESPALAPAQAEQLIVRCFRRKVNTLRCLGQKVLRSLLSEAFPSAAEGPGMEADASMEGPRSDVTPVECWSSTEEPTSKRPRLMETA
mmetsp:Transcript_29522/g.68726  ORF Transcript_29522/g.68726 Transcript_29522/m.68726 type:complete len:160 (-) Transcript_29522:153-632(-)